MAVLAEAEVGDGAKEKSKGPLLLLFSLQFHIQFQIQFLLR
jgi:hypothetical protein